MSDCVDTDDDVNKWKDEAKMLQQIMFHRLGNRQWDAWNKSKRKVLRCKVRFGLYPVPENLAVKNPEECKEEQSEIIKRIANEILKNSKGTNKIHFACIFVFGKKEDKLFYVPVFKVKGKQNRILFIDSDCGIYESWQDYLNCNHLPECSYCYPLDGSYQANDKGVLVGFRKSPACDPEIKMSIADNTTTVMNYASNSKMIDSLLAGIPIQAPLPLTSASTEMCNSTHNVEDQQIHSQSIGPNVSETLANWLRFFGNVLNAVSTEMHENITQAAAAGEVVTREEAIVYNTVTYGSLTVNGLDILRQIFLLIDKKQKGTLTDDDDLHFEMSVLFFTHNLLRAETARNVIENTQQEVLNRHCVDLTPSQIDELFKLIGFSEGKTQLQKNANNIKAINRIRDKRTFYESLVATKEDLEGCPVGFSSEPGVININNELHIGPNKFFEISSTDRMQILDAAKKGKDVGKDKDYRKKIEGILKKYRVVMEWQREEKIEKLQKAFNTDNLGIKLNADALEIDGKEIFKNMTPSELDRLTTVIIEAGKDCSKILKITNEFAKKHNCENPRDYSNHVAFVTKHMTDLKETIIANYEEALEKAKKNGVGEANFLHQMGVKCKKNEFFSNLVYGGFFAENSEESYKALDEEYIELKNRMQQRNMNMFPNFKSISYISHYCKHSDFNGKHLTTDEYLSIASELVNNPLNRRSAQLNQQGDRTMIVFTNPVNGAKGIVFEELGSGTQSLVTVFYDSEVLNRSY